MSKMPGKKMRREPKRHPKRTPIKVFRELYSGPERREGPAERRVSPDRRRGLKVNEYVYRPVTEKDLKRWASLSKYARQDIEEKMCEAENAYASDVIGGRGMARGYWMGGRGADGSLLRLYILAGYPLSLYTGPESKPGKGVDIAKPRPLLCFAYNPTERKVYWASTLRKGGVRRSSFKAVVRKQRPKRS